ncbi:MAG: CoA transferase, partial [Alphaproteobacteria bacterium]|nr:CoA transferase [Alphaproteobacteria bacterium]
LLEVIGRADLIDDPRFATAAARLQHEAEADALLSEWTRRHDKYEAMRLVGAAGVPAGAVFDTGDLLAEPSFAERGIIQTMHHPAGTLQMPTFPVRFEGDPPPVKPSPLLGEHTAEVFAHWLDMSPSEVEELRRDGII